MTSLTSAAQTVQPRGLSGDLFGSDGGKERHGAEAGRRDRHLPWTA